MSIAKQIVFIDLESTGTDPVKDRIVELGMCAIKPDGERSPWVKRFNPGMPIPPAATAIHGITDADVATCPPFSEFALRVSKSLEGKDLGGYNLRRFDLPLLDEELRRCGLKLSLAGVQVIDCYGIFAKKEPRKLEDAVRRYCGREHAGAHGALADAVATADVFTGQMAVYPELASMDHAALAEFCRTSEHREVDVAGKLYLDTDGDVRYAFGKYRDQKVKDHLDYASWMIGKDFPGSTVDALQVEIKRISFAQRFPDYENENQDRERL